MDYLCLVCINPNSTEPKVYGIVSWGYECGTPGFYAKTSAVIDWFDDVITGKYPPDPCAGGVCQMPEDVVSPGNYWFTNDLSNNETTRNRRDVLFEDGEIAREASWPWVVGITSTPKQDYCHVELVSTIDICDSTDLIPPLPVLPTQPSIPGLPTTLLPGRPLPIFERNSVPSNTRYAEYDDLINLAEIQAMNENFLGFIY